MVSKILMLFLATSFLGLVSTLGHRYDEEVDEDYVSDDPDEPDRREEEDEEEEDEEESETRTTTTPSSPSTSPSSPAPFTTTTTLGTNSPVLETATTEEPPTTTEMPTSTERPTLAYHSVVRSGDGKETKLMKEGSEKQEEEERYLGRGVGRGKAKNSYEEITTRRDYPRYAARTTTPSAPRYPQRDNALSECGSGLNSVRDPGRESLKTRSDVRRVRISRRRDVPDVTTTEATHYRGRRQRGNVRGTTTTTTTTPAPGRGRGAVSRDWRAREIERRRGMNGRRPAAEPEKKVVEHKNVTAYESKKTPTAATASRKGLPRGRYVEYEESEVFEDGKPVVKKKRVHKLVPESEDEESTNGATTENPGDPDAPEDSVKESSDSSRQISSTPRYGRKGKEDPAEEEDEEEEAEAPRRSKGRKSNWKDRHEDLYRYFHNHGDEDDDEYEYGPVGYGSERRTVRRKHYDPYQDYFDFVYGLSHPEDPYPHHHHGQNPHRQSTGVEEDSTPDGSAFRKRYFKAWHSTDGVDDDKRFKRGTKGWKEWEDEL